MRKAFEKIADLYKTPLGQDLLETAVGTGTAAGYQALFTDMTPEEIALSSGVSFGAGMIGRPIVGGIGQRIGKEINIRNPEADLFAQELIESMVNSMPKSWHPAMRAKLAPWAHLSGPEQLGAIIGHGYGDNLLQAGIALSAPALFAEE